MKIETRNLRTALAAAISAAMVAGFAAPSGALTIALPGVPGVAAAPAQALVQVAAEMADPRVKAAQTALAAQKFSPGPIDGVMGPKTREAIKAFQKARGMAQTGNLDVGTLSALNVR